MKLAEQNVCRLQCTGKRKDGQNCQRYIRGSHSGYYFIHSKLGNCDIRNFEWRCYQHIPIK